MFRVISSKSIPVGPGKLMCAIVTDRDDGSMAFHKGLDGKTLFYDNKGIAETICNTLNKLSDEEYLALYEKKVLTIFQ